MDFVFQLLFLILQIAFLYGTFKIIPLLIRIVELLTDIRDDARNARQQLLP